MMLLLAPPSHYHNRRSGYHISIKCGNDSGEQVAKIAKGFGCPDHILHKVRDCIAYSGRYDCIVTSVIDINRLREWIEDLGGSLTVTLMADLTRIEQ